MQGQQVLSSDREVGIEKIRALDLKMVVAKMCDPVEGYGWTPEDAGAIEEEYRRYLTLCFLHPDEPIVPSRKVDKMWHAHILDTRKYAQDCEAIFGRFLHHNPGFGMGGEEQRRQFDMALACTAQCYLDAFGEVLPEANGAMCECGATNCTSDLRLS